MDYLKRVLGFHKTPPVLVESCLFELNCVIDDVIPPNGRRLNKRFFQMKNFLFGKGTASPDYEECEDLAKSIIDRHVIIRVLIVFFKLSPSERSSFVQVFSTLVSRNHYHFSSEYMISTEGDQILTQIINNIANAELAAHSCLLLQECIKNRSIHNHILHSYTLVEPLFTDYAYDPHFDICSDVLQNIHLLLRDNKLLLTNDIQSDYSLFVSLFTWMRGLISCSNYITVRMSLSILVEVLADPLNVSILKLFMNNEQNIHVVMNLLCSPYNSIKMCAFDIFKLFVAFPKRPLLVNRILVMNRERLLALFLHFLPSNTDKTFTYEKKAVMSIITTLDCK